MIRITFFKDFTLEQNGKTLSSNSSGAHRLFRALAYLVKNRNRRVDSRDFARILHDKEVRSKGSDSLVKVTLHRLRELLSTLAEGETIIAKDGGIWFSPTLHFSADTDRFEEILSSYEKTTDPERRRFLFDEARKLYRGRYLASFFGESFTMPEAERYHRHFIALCEDMLARLIDEGDYAEVARIAQELIPLDTLCECFHYYRILALSLMGDQTLAASLYHSVWHLFQREFHVSPSGRFAALKAGLAPVMTFTVKTVDEALFALAETAKNRRDPILLQDPVAFFSALRAMPFGSLLLIRGDTEKLLPFLLEFFEERALITRLCDDTLFLFSTLEDVAFQNAVNKLKTVIDHALIKATLDIGKYPASPQ